MKIKNLPRIQLLNARREQIVAIIDDGICEISFNEGDYSWNFEDDEHCDLGDQFLTALRSMLKVVDEELQALGVEV